MTLREMLERSIKKSRDRCYEADAALAEATLSCVQKWLKSEGLQIVPVEITEKMYDAFFHAERVQFPNQMAAAKSQGRGWTALPVVVWEAMLSASPAVDMGEG